MSQDYFSQLAPFAAIVFAIGVVVAWRRRRAQQRMIALIHAENRKRQDFLIARIDLITQLLANKDLPLAQLEARTNAVVAEMESQNVSGALDALIADTTGFLSEELAKRRAP